MILEIDEETRDFVTIYKRDFYRKGAKKIQKFHPSLDYNRALNPLSGPFHEPVCSSETNELLTAEKRRDNIREHLKKIRAKYPHLRKILPETLSDKEMKKLEQKKSFTTIYQLEYMKDLDDYVSLRAQRTGTTRGAVRLPDGWIIPETTYQLYRNPCELSKFGGFSTVPKIIKPENNLKISKDESITTGNTEYADVIGCTGDRVFKEQLHGVPIPLNPPSSRRKGSDAISPECVSLLMKRETPFISNVF